MPHSAQMAGKSAAVGDAKAAGTDAPARGLWPQAPKTTASCEVAMARCETCGNDYDKAFQVSMNGTTHTFDSFECAIHALAPTCQNCGIRMVGHGLEKDGTFFCCEHCAEAIAVTALRDRIGAAAAAGWRSRRHQHASRASAPPAHTLNQRFNLPVQISNEGKPPTESACCKRDFRRSSGRFDHCRTTAAPRYSSAILSPSCKVRV